MCLNYTRDAVARLKLPQTRLNLSQPTPIRHKWLSNVLNLVSNSSKVNPDVSKRVPVWLRCHSTSQINASSWLGPELTSAHLNGKCLPTALMYLKSTLTRRKCLSTASTRFNSLTNVSQFVPTTLSRVDRNRCHSVPTSNRKCNYVLQGLLVIRLAIALGE